MMHDRRDPGTDDDQPPDKTQAGAHAPSAEARDQARRILERNDELIGGAAEATEEEEAKVAGVRTTGSRGHHSGAASGDYSND
jgi:hypothetical protein